jgi:hypothetical protein
MAKNWTQCAVIDTSALISALVSNYDFARAQLRQGRLVLTHGLKGPLDTESGRRQYLDFLASIRQKLITSHVLVESYASEESILKKSGVLPKMEHGEQAEC